MKEIVLFSAVGSMKKKMYPWLEMQNLRILKPKLFLLIFLFAVFSHSHIKVLLCNSIFFLCSIRLAFRVTGNF